MGAHESWGAREGGIKIKYAGEDMQHGFIAERICAYYNFVRIVLCSCTESPHTLPTPHFCASEVCARGVEQKAHWRRCAAWVL
jgi:hypothetical protein